VFEDRHDVIDVTGAYDGEVVGWGSEGDSGVEGVRASDVGIGDSSPGDALRQDGHVNRLD
jgi:hypothetical protein